MMEEQTIRLFKAVCVNNKNKKETSKDLMKRAISNGYIIAPEVIANYTQTELSNIADIVEREYGLSGSQMNASFHKSWDKVANAPLIQLYVEQIMHYITTYGYERLGIYDKDTVYIPYERLSIPALKKDIPLIVIKGYTKAELKDKTVEFLNRGIALKEQTKNDLVDVAMFTDITDKEIEKVANKEAKIMFYDLIGLVPENPIEFIRLVVYQYTKKTLLIKNQATIRKIKENTDINALKYFLKYERDFGYEKLAEVFYRFKPIFLALRHTNSYLRKQINAIRRLAVEYHKPMKEDYLNSVTAKIKTGKLNLDTLETVLKKVNTFRKIRLAYALNYRTKDADTILYKIRNGKGYATPFSFENKTDAKIAYNTVLKAVTKDIAKNVKGKKIFIPSEIHYALPATEKQFTGNMPSGSYVVVPKDFVIGVYWENVDGYRIDLDLSMMSSSIKIGWDANYRYSIGSRGNDRILFSGDLTDASNGSVELFYVPKTSNNDAFMLNLNYFNFDKDVHVPFKFFIGRKTPGMDKKDYVANPNSIVLMTKSRFDTEKQKVLGLVVTGDKENRFYFSEADVGKSITTRGDQKYNDYARKYMITSFTEPITLNDVLVSAGAKLVTDKSKADIDLSPEALEKDTIINLLK